MSEVIVVTSGKGGVGKTTTTANIGYALARHGFEVLLIDTDIGLRNLDVVMGLENRIVYNLVDVVEGNCRHQQAIIRDKQCDTLSLLPAAFAPSATSLAIASVLPVPLQYTTAILLIVSTSFIDKFICQAATVSCKTLLPCCQRRT